MNSTIFIVTHKETSIPIVPGNKVILVGAKSKKDLCHIENFDYHDNIGENISNKNKSYCELTGYYWIWKNIDCENVGICHYRRFFTKYIFSNSSAGFFTNKDMNKELSVYDVIVPKRYYFSNSVVESENIAPNKKDLTEIRKAIIEVSPNYLETYDAFLQGGETYLYNMCMMKKTLFNQYCEWLFMVLTYIEKHHDMSVEDDYRSRLFGFLSERLLYVWIKKNINQNSIKEVRVVKTDESSFRSFLHVCSNAVRRSKYIISKANRFWRNN